MKLIFEDQIAVVTGASRGVGKAIALSLAAQGATLCIVGRDFATLQAVKAQAETAGSNVFCYQVDLGLEQDLAAFLRYLHRLDFGLIDILVHSAAVISFGRMEKAPLDEFDWQYRVNVRAPYALTQALLPGLRMRQGQIVFVNSSVVLNAKADVGQYAATKHAFKGIADTLREEVNADGVRVLSIYLGRTASQIQQEVHKAEGKVYLPEQLLQTEDVAMMVINALSLPRTAEVTNISMRPLTKSLVKTSEKHFDGVPTARGVRSHAGHVGAIIHERSLISKTRMTQANNIPPRVSVGMPVYNGERYVRAALDTVLAQTFRDFELIISDNASRDATEDICREYAARDPRIRYSRNDENIGPARNGNRTIQLATGKYFKSAHHDDLCAPEFLARCIEVLEQHPTVVLCYPQSRVIDERGDFVTDPEDGLDLCASDPVERYRAFHRRFRGGNWWINPTFGVMRTEAIRKTRLEGSYDASDIVLLSELALIGQFHELPERLLYRRRHPEGSGYLDPWAKATFVDPINKGRILLPRWKLLFELAKALQISDLSFNDKLRCYPQIGLWFLRFFKSFVKDLLVAAKQIVRLFLQALGNRTQRP